MFTTILALLFSNVCIVHFQKTLSNLANIFHFQHNISKRNTRSLKNPSWLHISRYKNIQIAKKYKYLEWKFGMNYPMKFNISICTKNIYYDHTFSLIYLSIELPKRQVKFQTNFSVSTPGWLLDSMTARSFTVSLQTRRHYNVSNHKLTFTFVLWLL